MKSAIRSLSVRLWSLATQAAWVTIGTTPHCPFIAKYRRLHHQCRDVERQLEFMGHKGHFTWRRATKRDGFLLTAPPLRVPGAAGSLVTPVATG